jgi:putative ABC transport system ATP-binding protein
MEETTQPVIRISDLEFRYGEGDFHLRIPDLTVEDGSTAAFIGPSGSGKTTLLHLIAGIVLPKAGRIETTGVEVNRLSDEERRNFRVTNIGLVFQEFELLEYLSVYDNILLPYRINPSLRLDDAVRQRARKIAEQVGIGDKLARFPRRLSQGERQRVGVCRAVLTEPRLLFADEPTGNLDPENRERVLDILFDYVKQSGTTLLTVTHDHEILHRFARVVDFKEFHAGL